MGQKNLFVILISLIMLFACSNNNSTPDKGKIPNNNAVVEDQGKVLFEAKCAACHGSDGIRGIGNATDLQASRSDSLSVIQIISTGKGV